MIRLIMGTCLVCLLFTAVLSAPSVSRSCSITCPTHFLPFSSRPASKRRRPSSSSSSCSSAKVPLGRVFASLARHWVNLKMILWNIANISAPIINYSPRGNWKARKIWRWSKCVLELLWEASFTVDRCSTMANNKSSMTISSRNDSYMANVSFTVKSSRTNEQTNRSLCCFLLLHFAFLSPRQQKYARVIWSEKKLCWHLTNISFCPSPSPWRTTTTRNERRRKERSSDWSLETMNSCVAESKINNQTILEEQNNDNYEPTEEEIREYALYIGIDPEQVISRSLAKVEEMNWFAGRRSSLVSERRNSSSFASRMETVSRRTRRIVLFQFRNGTIVLGSSFRWYQ